MNSKASYLDATWHNGDMTVLDDYLARLEGADKQIIGDMYAIVREMVPDASEELSYAMPAFKYKGKSVVAIMANKEFLSLYPFGNVENLGLNLEEFERTSGSIHFSAEHPIPDSLLREIVEARLHQIG
jgi:uncharacterized protein YdhG (YjbR/CyaY superfamily)